MWPLKGSVRSGEEDCRAATCKEVVMHAITQKVRTRRVMKAMLPTSDTPVAEQ